jgi:hypothetical protein
MSVHSGAIGPLIVVPRERLVWIVDRSRGKVIGTLQVRLPQPTNGLSAW